MVATRLQKIRFWSEAVAALLAVHLVTEGGGEDDHIAVILNAQLCIMPAALVPTTRVCSLPQALRIK
jgi:hypothetical protein